MEELSSEDQLYNLWMLFNKTRNALFKARGKELAEYGITPVQAVILHIVEGLSGKATQAHISRLLLREPHTVSNVLQRMERKGLIIKTRDSARKNVVRIASTEEGKKMYHGACKRVTVHEAMLALSEEERRELWSHLTILLEKALEVLGKYNTRPLLPTQQQ